MRKLKNSTFFFGIARFQHNGNFLGLITHFNIFYSSNKFLPRSSSIVSTLNICSSNIRYLHCSAPNYVSARLLESERTLYGNLFYENPYASWIRPGALGIWCVSFVIFGNLVYGITSNPTLQIFSARFFLHSMLPLWSLVLGALLNASLSRQIVQRLYFDPRSERFTAITGAFRRRSHHFTAHNTEVLASSSRAVLRFTSNHRPFFVRTELTEDSLSKEFKSVVKLIENIRIRDLDKSKRA